MQVLAAACPDLTSFTLLSNSTRFTGVGVEALLQACSKLSQLTVGSPRLGERALLAIASHSVGLQKLDLAQVGEYENDLWSQSEAFERIVRAHGATLRDVRVCENILTDSSFLALCQSCANLENLEFSIETPSLISGEALTQAASLGETLRSLSVGDLSSSDAGLATWLARYPKLTRLDIGETPGPQTWRVLSSPSRQVPVCSRD